MFANSMNACRAKLARLPLQYSSQISSRLKLFLNFIGQVTHSLVVADAIDEPLDISSPVASSRWMAIFL